MTLHTFISSLPPVEVSHPLAAARDLLKKGIAVPYPMPTPTEDINWNVSFEKPEDITIVGSWMPRLAVKAQDKRPYCVDLAVEMPSSLFQEKDYLNGRFFHKRAYYLSVIAAALKTKRSGLNADLAFESASGDPRLTNLIIRPRSGMIILISLIDSAI
jgi:U3 small nucleolar RNA-associated protein 22